jgi:hypothetical protein
MDEDELLVVRPGWFRCPSEEAGRNSVIEIRPGSRAFLRVFAGRVLVGGPFEIDFDKALDLIWSRGWTTLASL